MNRESALLTVTLTVGISDSRKVCRDRYIHQKDSSGSA